MQTLNDRDVRALTECMSVLPLGDGLFEVVGQNGKSYFVDEGISYCTCPDNQTRRPKGGCKHTRRVKFEIGRRDIPDWVNMDSVDPLFGAHL